MNMVSSKCTSCGVNILINSKEFNDVFAHICVGCYVTIGGPPATPKLKKAMKEYMETQQPNDDDADWGELFTDGDIIDNDFEFVDSNDKICECGAEKANTPGHATWCPLYESK